ncbi:hypothetical protein SSX86_012693 [Deinandra increscens subsp. villosa]|uniref:non-specific serine/threonine protein kinase n=1 Tax=Deinandra increscens subsp. villosa TaxID=3103831 RepID=A0AAP0GZ11_9ASTR
MYQKRCFLLSVFIFLIFPFCTSTDTITLTQPVKDGDILVSNGQTFALGFFSPVDSTNRYVGIWYNKVSEQTIVWVANRDRPIANSSGILSVDKTGNLVLHEQGFSRLVVNESGTVERLTWHEAERRWIGFWTAPKDRCDAYKQCGPFGLCDPYKTSTFECDCLPGYEPQSPQDWYLRDGLKGCKRKVGARVCEVGDEFVEFQRVKVPDTSTTRVNMSLGLEACKESCLGNCTCTGYASADISKEAGGGGCITWHGEMNDMRTFSHGGGSRFICELMRLN